MLLRLCLMVGILFTALVSQAKADGNWISTELASSLYGLAKKGDYESFKNQVLWNSDFAQDFAICDSHSCTGAQKPKGFVAVEMHFAHAHSPTQIDLAYQVLRAAPTFKRLAKQGDKTAPSRRYKVNRVIVYIGWKETLPATWNEEGTQVEVNLQEPVTWATAKAQIETALRGIETLPTP